MWVFPYGEVEIDFIGAAVCREVCGGRYVCLQDGGGREAKSRITMKKRSHVKGISGTKMNIVCKVV